MVVARKLSLGVAAIVFMVGFSGIAVLARTGGANATPEGGGPADDVAASLIGTWTGTKSGAEGGEFDSREWRVVFRRVQANAVIGTKQYRLPNGRWSKAERVNAVVDSTGHIWASDTDGILNGSLSEAGALELIYQEPGTDDGAAVIAVLSRSDS
jgi:hypothetical protein